MIIPTIEYRGYELRAYSRQVFPPYGDPFAKGPRRFSSIVRIDTIPSRGASARRYSMLFTGANPTRAGDAIDLAMRYGKDIIDGNVQAGEL